MRLRHTREALRLNQREFAMRVNLKPNRYSQYETGARQLTIDAAQTICDEYGVSPDWLYRGDRPTLPSAREAALSGGLSGARTLPRKRGSRAAHTMLLAPDARFRGHDEGGRRYQVSNPYP